MSRLVGLQREQIAVLKAIGYSRTEVAGHYLKFVLVLAVVGSSLGVLAGAYLGRELTELYGQFFKLPVYDYRLDGGVVAGAVLLTTLAAVAGTLAAVRRAVSLPAAEAMRPEPPAEYRGSVLERLGLPRLLTPAGRYDVSVALTEPGGRRTGDRNPAARAENRTRRGS